MPPPSSSVGAARPPRHASISPRRRRALTRLALLILLACVVWSERPGGALRASRDHVRLLERFAESSDADAVAARDAFASLRDVGDPLPPTCAAEIAAAVPIGRDTLERSRLYATQAASARAGGVAGLNFNDRGPPLPDDAAARSDAAVGAGTTTQGMGLDALFAFAPDGSVAARRVRLDVPVRAIVVPLPARSAAARRIRDATRRVMTRWFPNVPGESESESSFARRGGVGGVSGGATRVWYQDPRAYHFSVFHASHHLDAHPALGAAAAAESAAVRRVARGLCPVRAALERVVVTRSGAVTALWNVAAGAEPREFRARLRGALPNAPARQIVSDEVIFHSTIARVLRPPRPGEGGDGGAAEAAMGAAAELTDALCGTTATLPEAWFVHEKETLALALGGDYDPQVMKFRCANDG